MITVRIPKSLHDSICAEANELAVSVNKLCITRMLQKIDTNLIPNSTQKRRGRRPGSAGTGKKQMAGLRLESNSMDIVATEATNNASSHASMHNA
jgi:hypothetical protein